MSSLPQHLTCLRAPKRLAVASKAVQMQVTDLHGLDGLLEGCVRVIARTPENPQIDVIHPQALEGALAGGPACGWTEVKAHLVTEAIWAKHRAPFCGYLDVLARVVLDDSACGRNSHPDEAQAWNRLRA